MKRLALVLTALITVPAASQQMLTAQAPATAVPEIPFDGVVNFLKLPAGMNFGEVAGVAVNSKGTFYIYDRAKETRLLEFDRTGLFVKEIGKDLYGFDFAHTVRVDKDDNVWCVDEGSNTVIKFSPAGRVLMVLGRKWESVEGRPHQEEAAKAPPRTNYFNRPTDVTWDPAGNIYVADGYNNSRVVKFDKLGNWIKTWGDRGTGPGQLNIPHTIASDAAGNVYVGDRTNRRIQVFDTEGKVLKQFTGIGQPWAICITPGAKQVIYSSDANSGKVYKLDLEGNILGAFGSFGKQPKQFGWIHEIACPTENELYVGELLNWRVQKVTLKPAK
jgi:DNA-binding beta-propeller fold protein YncE